MKFIICNHNDLHYGSEFLRGECSLTTYGERGDCSLLIDNTYLTLDFDRGTNKVIGISGFLGDLNSIEKREITIPSYSIASLFVDSEILFQPGIGYGMGMKAEVYYDRNKQFIMLENSSFADKNGSWYLIAENIYVSILKNTIINIYVRI